MAVSHESKSPAASRQRDFAGVPAASLVGVVLLLLLLASGCGQDAAERSGVGREPTPARGIQLGPRPYYLMDRLAQGPLRDALLACAEGPLRASRFSIGHRGAALQFPEHSLDSYRAAARMGAGMIECDATFTADRQLVCRHSQCDLHSTTNILETALSEKCSQDFVPARFNPDSGALTSPASARCCTSDLTLAELQSLEARMDAANARATTIADYLIPPAAWRTDLYTNASRLVSHRQSIALFRELGVAMMPELKVPMVTMPFEGDYSRRDYARQLIDEYIAAGVPASDVRLQSFDREDIRTWLAVAPEYGARAVWLDSREAGERPPDLEELEALYREGFRAIAPAIPQLLVLDPRGDLRASEYARNARAAGLEIITWTLERSGRIRDGRVEGRDADFYYGAVLPGLTSDGDVFRILHALDREVGVVGVFSDWPATTTYYASCFGLD